MSDYILLPNGSPAIEATYNKTGINIFEGNPLIEALPPIMSEEEVIKRLSRYPNFTEKDRDRDSRIREHMLSEVSQAFSPYGIHLELESSIAKTIRNGYINRNPLDKLSKTNFIKGYGDISEGSFLSSDAYSNTNFGIYIVGPPGVGKSMSIGLIMSLYPQVIVHSCYKGNQFSQYQLVYLKTNLPHDASVKGLCHDIIQKIDNLIGTDYSRKTRNLAVNKLVPTIGQIFSNTSLGCLIIDEIQHLTVSKQGQKAMIGFLLNIMSLGFPVVLLGTNISNSILQKELRLARRGSGMGTVLFNRIEDKDSMEWRLLTNMLFHCRILKKEFDDEENLRDFLFTKSQGIIDICSKIYVESQVECLRRKKESLTVDIIEKTVNNKFSFVQPMLEAIRSNDYYRMSLYEDIMPINAAINSRGDSSKYSKSSSNRAKSKELITIEKELEAELKSSVSNANNNQQNSGVKKSKIEVDQLYDNDIRKIIASGRDKKMSEYESLKEAGLIRNI